MEQLQLHETENRYGRMWILLAVDPEYPRDAAPW